jgi:hypothetical protein
MRKEHYISRDKEWEVLQKVMHTLDKDYDQVHAGNTLVVNVSPDYSSTVAMHLAHHLSHDGLMCDMLAIDVPYPDQDPESFQLVARKEIANLCYFYDHFLLVEAGVIRGGNYTWLTNIFRNYWADSKVITVALFENTSSKFQSDIVGEYYNDDVQDLTFYYERENKHWK